MSKITLLFLTLIVSIGYTQTLPFDFEGTIHGFVGTGGPVVTNGSGNNVLQIDAGVADWDNAQVTFPSKIDLSDASNNTLRFTIQSITAKDGEVHQHGVSFQSDGLGPVELNFTTTGQNVFDIVLNFGSGYTSRDRMLFFTDVNDFGVQSGTGGQSGKGTAHLSGTYIIDNVSLGADPVCGEENIDSQDFTNSNLPIIIIATNNGATISDEPKVYGTMKIIQRPEGARNFVCDADNEEYLNYSGNIAIETRGSSSQVLDKKPYRIDTLEDDNIENDNVALLGMAKENDWLLNSFAFDDSMMRDVISYHMAREMGQYAVNLQYCELIVNGDYRGLYALSEKIKIDGDRVDIEKLTSDQNSFPEVTGGYIIQTDRSTSVDPEAWYNNGASYIHEKPNYNDITSSQSSYIESIFRDLDNSAGNSNIISGYPAIIDVPSFIDYMIMAEIASNADSYALSTYYHKDRGGKLRAGPIWDYNLTFGNDLLFWGFDRSFTDVWQYNYSNTGAYFWGNLFNDSTFKCYLAKRFSEVTDTGGALNYDYISSVIDANVALISEAVVRENERWDAIEDFTSEISNMKSWLQQRITWMKSNLGSFSNCNSIQTPALVITKINYNPEESSTFTESKDLEFIEIKNTENTSVNLTGIYFEKLGISYQFDANKTIAAGESIILASDATTFQAKHGVKPFDVFSRNLSNKNQILKLSDAYGNVIDEVEYFDKDPWPETADGGGYYLELKDVNSDNSLASNWKATSISPLHTDYFDANNFKASPNPVVNHLFINSKHTIQKIKIFNLIGQQVKTIQANFNSGKINLNELKKGVYFLNLEFTNGNQGVTKIVKE